MNEFQNSIPKRLCFGCEKCNEEFPNNAFDPIPEGCGLYGWMFLKQEEHKQKVRKIDEDIVLYNVKIRNAKSNTKRKKFEHELSKKYKELEFLKQFGPIDF